MSEAELILKMYKGDTLLAVLSNIVLYDWPWYRCNFQPTSDFEQYRSLFDRELELLEDGGATEEWDLVWEKIEDLKLSLIYPDKAKVTELFLIHIEGETARFKAVFE